jgi:hypothetical protein
VALPFLHDIETQVRFLLALPLLIQRNWSFTIACDRWREFEQGLIPDAAAPKFDAAIASAMRLRNSITAEILPCSSTSSSRIHLAVAGGDQHRELVWRDGRWKMRPSLAGWWMGCVGLPLFMFLLLLVLPAAHLGAAHVAAVAPRVDDRPTSDRCGGLGFLGLMSSACPCSPGALLSGRLRTTFFSGAREIDGLQGGDRRPGDRHGSRRSRSLLVFGSRLAEANGRPAGIRQARAAPRTRVRRQCCAAARPRTSR